MRQHVLSLLLKRYRGGTPVFQTGANDLQTLADRLVQQSICASLSKHFPKITIIGEEVGVCKNQVRLRNEIRVHSDSSNKCDHHPSERICQRRK